MKIKVAKTDQAAHTQAFEEDRERLHRVVLTSVSHDLKTPLACVIGSLEIYERTKDKLSSDKKDILINTALQEAYRLDSFITNILDMAKFEGSAVRLKKELCVMDLLLEDCLVLLGHRLQACKVTIKAIPVTFPVTTDPLLLMRAICILLDNAAQYGGAEPVIDVEYEKLADQVVIRIKDNGSGIPQFKLEEIFSKYTRFDIADHKHAGTGLGLPICREIMRLLDGTVTVANLAGGKGALFTLAFTA
jgi:K+-sensing histidine kinase KdpD